jgi:hypothetical protein
MNYLPSPFLVATTRPLAAMVMVCSNIRQG